LLEKTKNDSCIFMHDLPAVKGNEVTAEIFESEAAVIWEQAENRKHTAKAIMLATLTERHG
jgi:ornithine carbamoyltransferase